MSVGGHGSAVPLQKQNQQAIAVAVYCGEKTSSALPGIPAVKM